MLSILSMYAISASTFLLGKQLVLYSSPLFLTGVRTLIAGSFFLVYVWYKKTGLLPIKKLLFPCTAIAIYSFFLSNMLKFWALKHITHTHAIIMYSAEPLLVVAMAYYMFNERMSAQKWIGMALCMSSGLMIVYAQRPVLNLYDWVLSVPSLFMCLAIVSSAYGALLMRRLIAYENASSTVVLGLSMMIGGIVALVATVTETSSCTITTNTVLPFAGNLVAMIALSNILAYSLYGTMITRYSVLFISCGSFVRPIFTALYRCILGNEPLSWCILGAAVLVVIGLGILYRDEHVGEVLVNLAE